MIGSQGSAFFVLFYDGRLGVSNKTTSSFYVRCVADP